MELAPISSERARPAKPAGPRSDRLRSAGLRTGLGLATGAVLALAFFRLVNVPAVYQRLTHLSIGFALASGAAFLSAYVVRALRWRWLLRPCRVSVPTVIAIYQVATFLNWLLPVRGGELAKSVLLRRSNGVPISRSLATVSMDKAMDLLPAAVLVAVLPFAGLRLSAPLWVLLISTLSVVVGTAVVLALAAWQRTSLQSLLGRVLGVLLPRRLREFVQPAVVLFVDTLLALIRQPRVMLIAATYTAVAVCLDALFCLLAFRAIGTALPVTVVLAGYTFFNLAFILPTPPGQIGSNELIGLLIFSGMFGVNRSAVAAMFLFSHPWTAILMTGCGLACLAGMGLSLRSTLQLARHEAEVSQA